MIEQNIAVAGLNTDYEISTILGNFSEEYIYNTIKSTLDYKFRPFGLRSPDYPTILRNQFQNIRLHSNGHDDEINDKEMETYHNIIATITEFYNLTVIDEIPDNILFTITYYLYQILVSEFTDRMINMITNYIIFNRASIVNQLPKTIQTKTNYSSKLYTNPEYITIYDNMSDVLDIIAGLDIDMETLFTYLSDNVIASTICTYIEDKGDIYKNFFASYITNQITSTDVLATVRLNFTNRTANDTKAILITDPIIAQEQGENFI